CAHEHRAVGGRGADRRCGVGAPLPGRRRRDWRGRPRLPARHPGRQRVRRGDPGPAHRAGPRPRRGPAGRHGRGRLVHHVLDLDAGNPAADRGAPARQGRGQRGPQPGGRGGGRRGRPPDRGSPVTEYQKLTSYFGERKRSGGAFVADALLELYGRHEIAASILLRGTEGFGLKHHLRTDRSLSLSEDLPLVAVAVDTRPRIEELLGPALALNRTGLVTVEGARLLDDTAVPGPDEETKLTAYLGRQERAYRVPAFVAVCDLLHRRGIDGATALLGVDGTAHGRRQRAAFFSRNAEVPMMIIAVGAGEQISRVLPELGALLRRPLLTLERVRVCKRDGRSLAGPGEDRPSQWQKLMVYTSEATRHQGQPVHRAIVRRLRSAGLSGATTLRGIWGFHGDHVPHGDRLLQLGRHVPAVTVVIDTPGRIARGYAIIDELTSERGLVTCETITCLDEAGLRAQARPGATGTGPPWR